MNKNVKVTTLNTGLDEFAKNVTTKTGEDGIIEKSLDIIGNNNNQSQLCSMGC